MIDHFSPFSPLNPIRCLAPIQSRQTVSRIDQYALKLQFYYQLRENLITKKLVKKLHFIFFVAVEGFEFDIVKRGWIKLVQHIKQIIRYHVINMLHT